MCYNGLRYADDTAKGELVMAKKVLVASGTSAHKLSFAIENIQRICAQKSVDVEVVGANIYEMDLNAINPDVIVTIGKLDVATSKPVISGMAFVTKMGIEKTVDEIIAAL